ncbi:hypothetical protein TS85_15140 [Sphingomonas hengshuiensis]|uniref:Uncharacterized protein n=2 Tax=Sphingomonas hengshuiensis TaxID=1609977 RepID=A0A7U4J9P6_9SPHN|nr:hypothetical protein TS85_15140 [Sphingomonas hengshuiensis]
MLFAPLAIVMAAPVMAAPKAPAATARATQSGTQAEPKPEDAPRRGRGKFWNAGGGLYVVAGLAALAGIVVLVADGGSSTPASP